MSDREIGNSIWLNHELITDAAMRHLREALLNSSPKHLVIDNLFSRTKLEPIVRALKQPKHWSTQQHTYSELYVNDQQWRQASPEQRFVQRDAWRPQQSSLPILNSDQADDAKAMDFLKYLRGEEFMSFLSHVFGVAITDIHVEDPDINTSYFRLGSADFVEQHADDSPGRKVCMLLYLNEDWDCKAGGQLIFQGSDQQPISIAPLYNRCVLFDPSSEGSEHWVKRVEANTPQAYRYNITSWYWSE